MKVNTIRAEIVNKAKDLPDYKLHLITDNLPSDIIVLDTNPTFDAPIGTMVLNKSDESVWVFTGEWKQLSTGGGAPLDPTSWAGIQQIVRAGKAQQYFNVGDIIDLGDRYTQTDYSQDGYPATYTVMDFKPATLEDGRTVNGMQLMFTKTLEVASSGGLSHSNVTLNGVTYASGYYRYDWCPFRQWFNSSGTDWYVSPFESDSENPYPVAGFLDCIAPELAAVLQPVKVTTVLGGTTDEIITTYDYAYLPSLENMCYQPTYTESTSFEDATKEGGTFKFFEQKALEKGFTTFMPWDTQLDNFACIGIGYGGGGQAALRSSQATDGSTACLTFTQQSSPYWTVQANTPRGNNYFPMPVFTIC